MNDKSVTGDDQLDWLVITGAVLANDFDLGKAAKRLKASGWPIGRNMARIRDALAHWETHIANLERTTHNPETRLAYRRLLADIRKTRHAPAPPAEVLS
jgi:hypothetical protein